jgi:DNA/RNA-binding domain of Phe-tRNA-synthetase-like protein
MENNQCTGYNMFKKGNKMKFKVESEIFNAFSEIKIIVACASNIKVADARGIDNYLNRAWRHAAEEGVLYGNPQSHPNIKPWGDSMKKLGVSRKNFPSSVESLVRRATKTPDPVRINPIVDFYNAVSLANIVPAGAYDTDELISGLTLRFSEEGDTFESLDSDEVQNLPEGEVSYADGKIIITRHFVWKQSKHTLVTNESKNVLFLAEILSEVPWKTAESVINDFTVEFKKYFAGDMRIEILDANNPEFVI